MTDGKLETDLNENASELVDHAYRLATSPESYDELLMAWDRRIQDVIKSHGLAIGRNEHPIASGVDDHLQRAFEIVDQLAKAENRQTLSLDDFTQAHTGPAFLARADGSIRSANLAAREVLGVHTHVNDIRMPADMATQLRERIANHGANTGIKQSVLRAMTTDDQSLVLVLSPFDRDPDEPLTLVITAEVTWNDSVDDLLQEGFSLTQAECNVTRALIAGQSVNEIATDTSKSVNTIRSQLSSILSKTGARKQSDLVRLIAGLSQVARTRSGRNGGAHAGATGLEPEETRLVEVENGRQVECRLLGPPGGRWVVFCHSLLGGPYISAQMHKELQARNIRLLAIARPGYGGTSPSSPDRTIRHDTIANDTKAVMSHFGTGPCVFLGQEAGGVQTHGIAARNPALVAAQLNISSGIPFHKPEHFSRLTPRTRAFMWTARLAPHILPLMISGAVRLFQQGKTHIFHRTSYGGGVDFEVCQKSEIAPLLQQGAEYSAQQGSEAIMLETVDLSLDWSEYLAQAKHKVVHMHGDKNGHLPARFVEEFAAGQNRFHYHEVQGGGVLLMYSHEGTVAQMLDSLMHECGM